MPALPFKRGDQFDAVGWLARHFIHLQCYIRVPGHRDHFPWGISGAVVEVDGEWFFATAGHCLRYVEEKTEEGWEFRDWHIDDTANSEAKWDKVGPFDFRGAHKAKYFEEGIGVDYGFVHLRYGYTLAMRQNGIVPFTTDDWQISAEGYDEFCLLGVPQETVKTGAVPAELRKDVSLIQIESADDTIVSMEAKSKAFGRHFFRIVSDMECILPGVTSIKGMSGGPVIGVEWDGLDGTYSWLGLLSGWNPTTKVLDVMPIDHRYGKALELTVDEIRKPQVV